MEWEKISRWLFIAELIVAFFAVLYVVKIAFGDTIGIGVSPAVLKYNFPAVYSYEFCFFNQGDTDAVYVIQSGDIRVLNEMNFIVPANTNYDNCVKKTLQLIVDKSGYFYVLAYPNINQSSTISIVRRVGVKVELNYLPTTTTISQSSSGGSFSVQTTTTTIRNQTSNATLTIRNETSNATNITSNFTSNATIGNATNSTNQTSENPKSGSDFLDILASMSGVFIVVIIIVLAYFVVVGLDLI
jgi:hypothetical protein